MKQTVALLTIEALSLKPIEFVKLELDQCFNDHHRVKIVLDLERIGEDALRSPLQKAALLHEKVLIDIMEGNDLVGSYTFAGLITDVHMELDKGCHGFLHLFAASTTIELERGKMLHTFSDTDLQVIVGDVTKGLMYLKHIFNTPRYSWPIRFSMQYRETDFQYLRRLAWMYGERFFYTGEALVFGDFDKFPTVKLKYDVDLTEVKICTQLIANTFQQYYRDIDFAGSTFEHSLSERGTFPGEASARSDRLNYLKKPNMPLDVPVFEEAGLQDITKMRKERTFTDMYHVRGETRAHRVCIGRKLEIDFGRLKVDDSLGTLRVIRVRHVFDEAGRYYNEFEAVPVKFDRIPFPDVDIPVAHAIPATVIANADPEGLGKILVRFDFELCDCDYWMPLMQPEAGQGETRNRGYSFIPELGDTVLVSFFEGNPEFPFVMGSLFHGKNAANLGGGKGNHIKFIRDKSGSEIVMNTDKQGGWGITIRDRKGDLFQIDTQGENILITANKNITISAGETMTLDAKNLHINVTEDMSASVGKDQQTAVGENQQNRVGGQIDISSDTLQEDYSGDVKTNIDGAHTIHSKSMEWSIDKDAILKAGGRALVQGSKDARISKGQRFSEKKVIY